MPLLLRNQDLSEILSMDSVMQVPGTTFKELYHGEAVTAPRADILSPSPNGQAIHGLKSMSGVILSLRGHGWGHDGGPGYGIQFTAMAKLIYDLAKERGVGRELPLEWFQQNVNS